MDKQTLQNANYWCIYCGKEYGESGAGTSIVNIGKCDACRETESTCGVRDYGYLKKGISLLPTGDKLDG